MCSTACGVIFQDGDTLSDPPPHNERMGLT